MVSLVTPRRKSFTPKFTDPLAYNPLRFVSEVTRSVRLFRQSKVLDFISISEEKPRLLANTISHQLEQEHKMQPFEMSVAKAWVDARIKDNSEA